MAQANSFDANSSQIQVEHDKKRRQFVIRLNGRLWVSGLAQGVSFVTLASCSANTVVVAPREGLQLPFQAQLLSSAHDNEASQKLVFSSGFLNNKPNQTYFFLKSKGL